MKNIHRLLAGFLLLIVCNSLIAQTCTPIYTALPFYEGFEAWQSLCGSNKAVPSASWLNEPLTGNNSWRRDDEGATANWTLLNYGLVGGGVAGTPHTARFHGYAAGNNVSGSLSAYVNLSGGFAAKELSFYHFNYYGGDSLFVELSADGGATFQRLKALGSNGYRWDYFKIEFLATSPTSVIRFRALTGSTDHSDIGIDEMTINAVACYTPVRLAADPLLDGANLYFTPSSASTPSGYEYAVSQSATAPASGTYTSTTSAVVTGLAPSTTYYAFLRSVCTGSGSSPWISTSFKTATADCVPVYSYPCSYSPSFSLIRRFRLKGENNTIIDKQAHSCAGEYFDYTSTSITLARGKTYNGIITVDTFTKVTAWVDFNDDHAFTTGEKIWDYLDLVNNDNQFGFHIPAASSLGTHKMRLRLNSADPCNNEYNGQAHDYTVVIVDSASGSTYNVSGGKQNTCISGGGISINPAFNNHNSWVPFVDSSNNIIAAIKANGNTLNFVSVYEYVNGGTIRTLNGKPYLDRNLQLSVQTQPTSYVSVRLYLLQSEFNALKLADPTITTLNDLWLTKTTQACGNVMGAGQDLQPVNSGTTGNGYFVEYRISSFSSFFFHGTTTTLPVDLLPLRAIRSGDSNTLNWSTTTEKDNSGFELQVSSDGNSFQKLAFVPTKAVGGNSNMQLYYAYTDGNSYNRRVYYRLQLKDKNGNNKWSNTVFADPLHLNGLQVYSVFPNPAKNKMQISLYAPAMGTVRIQVINVAGKTVLLQQHLLIRGDNNVVVNIAAISAGTYFIKVSGAGKPFFSKLVKL